MLKKRRRSVLLRWVLLSALPAAVICAQPLSIHLDPAKTQIEFTLEAVLHTVHGTFRLTSGHIDVNPESKTISGEVVVDASSGESGSQARDSRMKKNILETGRYPEITFTPTAIKGDLAGMPASVTVTGWFAIHGQRHPLSIPLQVRMSGGEATATGKFIVPYVEWGMKNPSTFLLRVDQQVEVSVTARGSMRHALGEKRHPLSSDR